MVKNDHGLLVHETLKFAYLKNKFINWAGFLNVDSDAIMFGFYSLYFICWGSTAVVVLVFLEDAEIEKVLVSKKISKPKKNKYFIG